MKEGRALRGLFLPDVDASGANTCTQHAVHAMPTRGAGHCSERQEQRMNDRKPSHETTPTPTGGVGGRSGNGQKAPHHGVQPPQGGAALSGARGAMGVSSTTSARRT